MSCSSSRAAGSNFVLMISRKYYASFGGLLLYIEGPFRKLTGLKIDNIYMLLKRS